MILRTDPHYLNAWNRLALQPLVSFCLNTPSSNKAFSVNLRIYELIAWQENCTGSRVPTGLFLLFLFLSFIFPFFALFGLSSIKTCKKFVRDPFHWLLDYAGKLAVFALSLPAYTLFQKWWQVVNSFVFITIGPYCLLSRLKFFWILPMQSRQRKLINIKYKRKVILQLFFSEVSKSQGYSRYVR